MWQQQLPVAGCVIKPGSSSEEETAGTCSSRETETPQSRQYLSNLLSDTTIKFTIELLDLYSNWATHIIYFLLFHITSSILGFNWDLFTLVNQVSATVISQELITNLHV